MQPPQIDTKPPVGNADASADPNAGGGLAGIAKMMFIQFVHGQIQKMKIPQSKKFLLYTLVFLVNFYYNTKQFVDKRPQTLYDHFGVSRMATTEELKDAKLKYLTALDQIEDPELTPEEKYQYMNFTMTKEQVNDTYEILTHSVRKEAYDKHNKYYTKESFEKKGKSIPTIEKYMGAVQGMIGFCPFFLITFMALGSHATCGRQMAITGLLVTIYLTFEVKKPAESGRENHAVETINNYHFHPYLQLLLGSDVQYWTVHQFMNYLRSVVWQSYFQYAMALSRLIDIDPDAKILESINYIGQKNMKCMQIFETLSPLRSQEIRDKEISAELKKVLEERDQLNKEKEQLQEDKEKALELKPADESEPKEDQKQEDKEPKEEDKKEPAPAEQSTQPEELAVVKQEDLTHLLKALTPDQYSEIEAKLMEREEALKQREKELDEREEKLKVKALEQEKKAEKSTDDFIKEERAKCIEAHNRVRKPLQFLLKELEKTTWGMQIKGSWKHVLDLRKEHVVQRAKEDLEIEKEEAAAKSRFSSWFDKLWNLLFYLGVAGFIFFAVAPIVAINYIKGQIQTGEWVNVDAPAQNVTANITMGANATWFHNATKVDDSDEDFND